MSRTKSQPGVVVSYECGQDRDRGVVDFCGRRVAFGSSYFHMGCPARHPKAGDKIEAVTFGRADGSPRVLYIRPRRGTL